MSKIGFYGQTCKIAIAYITLAYNAFRYPCIL